VRPLLLAGLLPLCGCVTLSTTHKDGEAVSTYSRTFGIIWGCGMLGIGVQRCDQIRIDARTCGVAIVENPDPETRKLLARIAEHVRAQCLHSQKETVK
jgi:hypothetical protein